MGVGVAGASGESGASSTAGAAGATNTAGTAGAPHPESEYCGDSLRDPLLEECDTGPEQTPGAPCTPDCRAISLPVATDASAGGAAGAAGTLVYRTLDHGRHVMAATEHATALVYAERTGDRPTIFARLADSAGVFQELVDVSVGAQPTEPADPVVAELPDDRFAVVWEDLSGGSLDVALQVATVGGRIFPPPWIANETTVGAQSQPDAMWAGDRLIIAWTDQLDVKYREFSGGATPLGAEQVLAATAAFEASVALTRVGETGWAAAWRAGEEGLERIRVRYGDVEWETTAFLPGASEDRPALVELDAEHLLVLFTEGTSPDGGPATVSRLRFALLYTASPGEVTFAEWTPMLEPYASDTTLAERRPALERVGDEWYAAWETDSPLEDEARVELFWQRVSWSAEAPETVVMSEEEPLPLRRDTAGEQRAPALGASRLWPGGALGVAWEDRTGSVTEARYDVLFTVRPVPFVVLADDAPALGD